MRAAVVTPMMIAALAATGSAAADDLDSPVRRADEFLERGLEHYDEGNYELALVEFRAGYRLDPRPEFLFALAQAERLSGDCTAGIVYYERYLATGPNERQAEAARLNLKRCQRALESRPDAPLEDTAEATDGGEADAASGEVTPPSPGAPPSRPSPWYRDVLAVSLVTGGAAGLGAGAWSWRAARSEARSAGAADAYAVYAEHMNRARTYRTIAWVSAGASAAAFTGAVVRGVTHGRGRPERAVAVTPLPDGAVIAIGGRF